MSTTKTVTFKGAIGTYQYFIYPLGTTFYSRPGNYCFAREDRDGNVSPLYFGETDDLRRRLNEQEHECIGCVTRHGCNVICAHTNDSGRDARLAEETDLRRAYDTPCNRQ